MVPHTKLTACDELPPLTVLHMCWVTAKLTSSIQYLVRKGGVREGHVDAWVDECVRADEDIRQHRMQTANDDCCLMAIFDVDMDYEVLTDDEKHHLKHLSDTRFASNI